MRRFRRSYVPGKTTMQGDPAIIRTLNAVLTNELTAVNQYFLHARMFESWGLKHLGQIIYDESIGESAVECLGADLELELGGRKTLIDGIAQAEAASDFISRQILTEILADTEEHIDFLEAQFKLIEQLGEQNYLQSAMTEIAPDKSATGN